MKERHWFEVLPTPYDRGPHVIVTMVPNNWHVHTTEKDGQTLAIMKSPQGMVRGLQVVDTAMDLRSDHQRVFEKHGISMADVDYVGPLGGLPDWMTNDLDREPFVFCRDVYWRRPVGLRTVWKGNALKC